MLRKATSSCVSLADSMVATGVTVTPIPGTPLDSMVKATTPMEAFGVKVHGEGLIGNNLSITDVEVAINKSIEMANTSPAAGHQSLHNDLMEDAVERFSTIVNKNILLARNIINPLIHDIIDKASKEADLKSTKGINIDVMPLDLKGIWQSDILSTLIGQYANHGHTTLANLKYHPDFADVNIGEIIGTTSHRMDVAIQPWLEAGGLTTAEAVWNDYFAAGNGNVGGHFGIDRNSAERALAAFLLAWGLYNKRPYEVAIGETEYTYALEAMLYISAGTIADTIRENDDVIKAGKLVLSYPVAGISQCDSPVIHVNGSLYERWLETGGSPEILFGAYLSDKVTDGQYLVDNAANYLDKWHRHVTQIKYTQDNNRIADLKSSIKKHIAEEIERIGEEYGASVDAMYGEMAKRMEELSPYHLDDLYSFLRDIICDVMYPRTEAKRILQLIDAYGKKFPNINPRELGLLAVANLVAKWVAEMMQVKKG